jgi:hypothetical protein
MVVFSDLSASLSLLKSFRATVFRAASRLGSAPYPLVPQS